MDIKSLVKKYFPKFDLQDERHLSQKFKKNLLVEYIAQSNINMMAWYYNDFVKIRLIYASSSFLEYIWMVCI